ncbi:hypothetical protein BDL97_09G052300 [Sphagnum fallax]|nr:hypothetical protein BDL97_09G052300 [Sphagnum fallax]
MAKSNHGKDSLELIALPKNTLPSNLEKVYHGTSVGASSPKAVSDSLSPRLKQFPGFKIIASKEASLTSRVLRALRKGRCIAILDSKSKEVEIDLLFLVASFSPLSLKTLKTKARRELYIFVAHEVICTFGFPFIGEVLSAMNLMKKYPILQRTGKEKNLKIGVSNVERISTFVNLKNEVDRKEANRLFVEEFHTPSHIFLCTKNVSGLQVWNGHIELSVVLAKLVGIVPILICQNPFYKTSSIPKCFMLCKDGNDFGALPPEATKAWALGKNIPFLIGLYIINVFQGGARS